MENFVVSARKYRPVTFDTVVGQKSITTTLKNAIRNNQLAHAYLFCGPRGVGKTTCARIFAKTINCYNLTSNYEACNECESCKSFNESRSYNIHELDAASNNSVDDIRNLIEQVRIPPQIGSHSVYIIDEVHMLSSAAFNAFLKTLEEPPKHARFILATTEKHKILPTILSRCQVFDFNRIRIEDTVEHLMGVAEKENIKAEVEGLTIIAQKADGGMRDALSIFDQIVSFSGDNITYQQVIENLNVLDYELYFKIVDAFLSSNIAEALLIFNDILNKGFDGHHFITGLSSHFRDLLVCKDESTIKLLEVGATIKESYKQQAQKSPTDFLIQALTLANSCDLSYKGSQNQRLLVELTLVQICDILNQKKKSEALAAKAKSKAEKDGKQAENTEKQPQEELSPEEAEQKKKSLLKKKKQGVSIKAAMSGEIKPNEYKQKESSSENIVEENVIDNLVNDFTQEQLNKVWAKLAEKFKSQPRLYNTLNTQKPIIKENYIIHLPLNNSLQENALTEKKNEILYFLKNKLQNTKIDIAMVIEANESTYKPFTKQDKYNLLSEKNPILDKLKDEFGLEL